MTKKNSIAEIFFLAKLCITEKFHRVYSHAKKRKQVPKYLITFIRTSEDFYQSYYSQNTIYSTHIA